VVEIYLALSLAGNSQVIKVASHGISIIVAMYYFSKIYYKTFALILDRVIAVASGAIFVRLGNFFNSEIIGKKQILPSE
jgi:prolipoprotein diacylglyceryltransferase